MTDRARAARLVAPALLLGALAVGWIVPSPDAVRLATPDRRAVDEMTTALDALPDRARVLVGFDPDVGTYAEVRPTVRVLLADLLERNARVALVSLTAEGRALAITEGARLERESADAGGLRDLGFVAGAEAALVDLAAEVANRYDAMVVVGGNDLGPRSWVEQVLPRAAEVPLLAVTPAILLPEVRPYLVSGQLDAALITPGEGAAYRASLALDASAVLEAREPSALAILVGMLAAVAVLGQALGARMLSTLRTGRARDAA
jgi:hypothetical protein